jgi:hypothetical protein
VLMVASFCQRKPGTGERMEAQAPVSCRHFGDCLRLIFDASVDRYLEYHMRETVTEK